MYEDIIDLPHFTSSKRQRMSREARAAQFSPFAALTGHDEAIRETARLTDKKIELDDETKMILNDKMNYLLNHIASHPEITVMRFVKDSYKSGGRYEELVGEVRRYDYVTRTLKFADMTEISVDDIIDIKGECFPGYTDIYDGE